MNPNVIQFACNHCQSWLTVPAHMAGVAGPCPKCGQHIVSPTSSGAPPAPPAQIQPQAPPAQPPQSQPGGMPWAARPPTGGLGMPQTQLPAPQYQPPPHAETGWGPPPVVPGAPLPVMPSVPMPPEPVGHGHSQLPQAPGAPWGAPQGQVQNHPPMQSHAAGNYVPPATMGQPSVALQPTLLRPQSLPQDRAAAPPPMPPNAIADAMRNLPTGMPPQSGQKPPTSPLTRPAAIGGSRLSLLARQLTTSMDGNQGLPQAPEQLSREVPAQSHPQGQVQDSARRAAAAPQMSMPQQASSRGYSRSRGGGGGSKLATAAAFLILAAVAAGYTFRDQLRIVWERTRAPAPSVPSTIETPSPPPRPGVDLAPDAVAGTPPPKAPAPSTPPAFTPAPSLPPAPPVIAASSTSPLSSSPQGLPMEKVPPRAMPVTDDQLPGTPDQNSVGLSSAPSIPGPAALPVPPPPPMGIQSSRTPDSGMVASSASASLVEVGRAKDDPSILPKPDMTPLMGNSDRPLIKNVPPVCDVAVQGLKKFLAAPNWKERMRYMQLPEQMERKAQIYYASNLDGPVPVDEIRYLRHDADPQIGKGMHAVFELVSRAWDYTVPVMVEQTGDEARVDWLTFVEFKDDLLNKFVANYMDGPVRFHVGIRRSHYFEDNVPNVDLKDAYEVTTPMENVHGFVFTPKGTPLARSLASTISWDKEVSWVVVELQWRKEGTSKWIELTALPQLNWYSDGTTTPESVSAPSSPVAVPMGK